MILNNIWAMESTSFARMTAQLSGVEAVKWPDDLNAQDSTVPESAMVDDAKRAGLPVRRVGSTAIVSLIGPMVKRGSFIADLLGFASTLAIQRAVEAAAADETIETIVLEADTPGGSVEGLSNLADAIAAAAKAKDVVAVVDSLMASAGLFVGAQATRIVMDRDALIGSIGTRILLLDASKMFEDAGIEVVNIDTGEFKSAGILGTEVTDNHRADFQRLVDGFFEKFVSAVERGRGMDREKVMGLADGRLFSAEEAVKNGLADDIQSMDDVLQSLAPRKPQRRVAAARIQLDTMKRNLI
ncbi:MAG: S49 family peptidase [Sphingomonadales bacterium]